MNHIIQAYLLLLLFALLPFIDTVYLQIEGLWQPCLEQVCWCHFFPTAFAHSLSLCHILFFFLQYFNYCYYYYICYIDPWSMITIH